MYFGFDMMFFFSAQVRRVDVNNYTPRKTLVTCQVRVCWDQGDKSPTPLSHDLKLSGAKEFDFLTVTSPRHCIGMWYTIIPYVLQKYSKQHLPSTT